MIPAERVAAHIYAIRGVSVMLDSVLATLYRVLTRNLTRGGRRYRPYVYTEQGVAMLSSVLKSERAAEVNVAIMRTFVKMRRILATNEELARKVALHDRQISALFEHVQTMLAPPPSKRKPIGFAPAAG